ncbi:MAG: squalene/phytoene synthase family protein [Steroidobacteraceae bacterium]
MTAPDVAAPPRTAGARYFAWLYTPAPAQAGTAALLTLEHEIMTSTGASLDHTVAHARLGWWQEETARLAAAVPAHPASRAAQQAFLAAGLPAPDLQPLADLAARGLARHALARDVAPGDLAGDAALWADGLVKPLAVLACGAMRAIPPDEGVAAALGHALYGQEQAPAAASAATLRAAIAALPAALAAPLRGLVVWSMLALHAGPRGAFAETWAAWRAARRVERGRLRG